MYVQLEHAQLPAAAGSVTVSVRAVGPGVAAVSFGA